MRGATRRCKSTLIQRCDFNPRTPCGVRHEKKSTDAVIKEFQSTHPMRGATGGAGIVKIRLPISIHAPHAGCDLLCEDNYSPDCLFQSTHPMRGATVAYIRVSTLEQFQSTHPMRGATYLYAAGAACECISIHAPHAGCDRSGTCSARNPEHFNPRTPCGVRLCRLKIFLLC